MCVAFYVREELENSTKGVTHIVRTELRFRGKGVCACLCRSLVLQHVDCTPRDVRLLLLVCASPLLLSTYGLNSFVFILQLLNNFLLTSNKQLRIVFWQVGRQKISTFGVLHVFAHVSLLGRSACRCVVYAPLAL